VLIFEAIYATKPTTYALLEKFFFFLPLDCFSNERARKKRRIMKKIFYLWLCLFIVLAACAQPAQLAEPEESGEDTSLETQLLGGTSPIGTNLADISPFNNVYAFIDAFKNARTWVAYGGQPPITADQLDANGWIKFLKSNQESFTQIFNDTDGTYPAGDYILLYDGEGTLSVGSDAVTKSSATRTGNTTRQIITVTPQKDNPTTPDNEDAGIFLGIDATNPTNYIRNIRVIMPGGTCTLRVFRYIPNGSSTACKGAGAYVSFETIYKTRTFHPLYLRQLASYNTLRFMSYMQTNGSTQGNWNNRPKLTDASWASEKGVPAEAMVELVNTLDANAWFNMPHAADDTYVREFAKLVKAKLEPGRNVYVEYSNELWLDRREQKTTPEGNPESAQFDYAVDQGAPLVTTSECNAANANVTDVGEFGQTGCKILKQQRYQVKRSLEIFSLWQQNFGSSNLVRVLSSTTLATRVRGNINTEELLKYQDAYKKIDALAVAPYVGDFVYAPVVYYGGNGIEGIKRFVDNNDFTGYFNRLNTVSIGEVRGELREQKQIIEKYNARLPQGSKKIPMIAYEGGQFLSIENQDFFDPTKPAYFPESGRVAAFFTAVNRDPRMKQVYLNYFRVWREEGGQLFNHFVDAGGWAQGQSYGALESLEKSRSQSPKYDGIRTFIEQNPRWW
jgi:hypothetical protein